MPSIYIYIFTITHLYSPYATGHGSKLNGLGVNYGTLGNNLPSPAQSVQLIRALNAGSVKIYDANATILSALAGTGLGTSIMVPNQILPDIAANQSAADAWICTNVLPFRNTRILYLLVGNEILSDYSIKNSTWQVTSVVSVISSTHPSKLLQQIDYKICPVIRLAVLLRYQLASSNK